MNMSISAVPNAAGNVTATAQSGSSNGSSTGLGFAGLLVQTIGGDAGATTTGSTPLPLGLTGMLAKFGLTETDGRQDDLMAMLANLVDRLEQAEQGDELSDDATASLAQMLIAFQGVLQQIGFIRLGSDSDASVANGSAIVPEFKPAEDATPSQVVAGALKTTLQQLATVLAQNGQAINAASPTLTGELRLMLNALNDQLQAQTGASTPSANVDNAKAAEPATTQTAIGKAGETVAQKDAANQSIVASADAKRIVAPPRDPVWRFQVVPHASENASSDGLNSNVAPVASSAEAPETGGQPLWTMLQHDAKATPDVAQAKPTLPAQVPVQQFAQQMDKFLVKQFLLAQGNGTTEAKLSLTPEHLGQVDIRIVMHNGQLTAQFMTTSAMAREMIENQMAQLRASLSAQGLQVDRLEVVQQPSSSEGAAFLHQEQRERGSGRNGQSADRNGSGTYDESLGFEDELERTSSLREAGYGSSLNVTA